VNNVLRLGIAGPGDILLPIFQRHSDGVHAGHELSGFAEGLDYLSSHSGHDPHILNHVGGVGELYADIRHRRADRAHGKGDDVHSSAAHASFEERLEDVPHLLRVHPVVGGAGLCFTPAADEGAVFYAGHVAGVGPCEEGVGAFFRIEGDEGARGDKRSAYGLVFLFRAVAPVDKIRLAVGLHGGDPGQKTLVFTYEGGCIIMPMNFLRGFVMSFFIIRLFFDFVHLKSVRRFGIGGFS